MNKKQTAVEFLEEIYLTTGIDRKFHFAKAKEMEKEQKGYSYEDMKKCWDASKRFEKPISEGYAPNFNEFIEQFKKKL
jgi:hypothetical protein